MRVKGSKVMRRIRICRKVQEIARGNRCIADRSRVLPGITLLWMLSRELDPETWLLVVILVGVRLSVYTICPKNGEAKPLLASGCLASLHGEIRTPNRDGRKTWVDGERL